MLRLTLPLVFALIADADPAPVSTLRDLGPALASCYHAPEHSNGSEVTVRFSLTSRGTIIGRPIVTYSRVYGSESIKRDFIVAVVISLWRCTPIKLTPEFGRAIAGRPISIRVLGGAPAVEI